MAHRVPEYKIIERNAEGWRVIASEDITFIEDGGWEIIYFYVNEIAYVLQLKKP